MATGETPVLDTLAEINGVSLARAELDVEIRVAALVAVDRPPRVLLRPAAVRPRPGTLQRQHDPDLPEPDLGGQFGEPRAAGGAGPG